MRLAIFQPDDDFFTDRLCRRYGPLVFITAAILIAGAYASPWSISCWTPANFEGSHVEYSNNICWNTGEFYIMKLAEEVPSMYDHEPQQFSLKKMRYLPVVLLLQIMVYFIPRLFWKTMNTVTGYSTGRIVKGAQAISPTNSNGGPPKAINARPGDPGDSSRNPQNQPAAESVNTGFQAIAAHLVSVLETPFPFLGNICSMFGGYSLVITYFLTKVGYLLTCIVQMAILSRMLNINFFTLQFGERLWSDVIASRSHEINNVTVWTQEEIFPKIGLCDFYMRRLGNIQRYTLQCSISGNDLVERVVVCLWLWLWVKLALLSVSTLAWLLRLAAYFIAPKTYKIKHVSVLLGRYIALNSPDDQQLDRFSRMLLKPDGALILEILEDNVSLVAASEVVKAAWVQFQQCARREEPSMQQPMNRHQPAPAAQAMYPQLGGSTQSPNPSAPETLPLVDKSHL